MILIAEDDESVAARAREIRAAAGYRVLTSLIQKPYQRDALLAKIASLLALRNA